MRREIRAIYENGILRPIEPLELEEQQRVRVTIDDGDPLADLSSAPPLAVPPPAARAAAPAAPVAGFQRAATGSGATK